eukprot:TRINITY_DN80508_c0_g1_i1.p1 TRINITY_DN80508_c0_g1~~TRINITY_DN80508_c0_g1_i1.p1  ORF type:complete len:394 (+),score=22.97 TRINITY_DN80508_c0_g1_i1:68-1249(+)
MSQHKHRSTWTRVAAAMVAAMVPLVHWLLPSATVNYAVLSDERAIRRACLELQGCPGKVISLDCEGKDLGRDGVLSLVQAASPGAAYIFDVHATGGAAFDWGLRSLLEDPSLMKLMFDCRNDADALQHLHNVHLRGVRDLQLLEVMTRDDTVAQQRTRLHACLYRRSVEGQPQLYEKVHKLSGLSECLDEFGIKPKDTSTSKAVKDEFRGNPEFWLTRPLPDRALEYAEQDVESLHSLHELLSAIGGDREYRLYGQLPLTARKTASLVLFDTLDAASECYASHLRQLLRLPSVKYRHHALLPLGIVPESTPRCKWVWHGPFGGNRYLPTNARTASASCECCLQVCTFSEQYLKRIRKSSLKRRCAVCRAIDINSSVVFGNRYRDHDFYDEDDY